MRRCVKTGTDEYMRTGEYFRNRVVKAFAREDYEIEKFDRANTDYAETNKATGMVWLKFFPIVESIANLMPVVLLAVGGVL